MSAPTLQGAMTAARAPAGGGTAFLHRLEFFRGIGYISPAILLIGFILVIPSIYGFIYSLYHVLYLVPTKFVGFQNYQRLFTDPALLAIVLRSIVFTTFAVLLTVTLALAMAIWIDQLDRRLGLAIRILVVIPWVISHVVGALLFRWVFVNDIGLGLYVLDSIGFTNFRPLEDGTVAMIVLIGYACWRTLGFALLLFLAGLKSIPAELYEAAHVDGASDWQRFVRITLPMIRTPMLITLVMLTVSNLNNVEAPLIVTGGGPADATNILPLDLYIRAFARFDFNTAMALGIGMFVANILLAVAYVRLVRRNG